MEEDNPPLVSDRALFVHLIGELRALREEHQALRQAFDDHTRSVRRHRVLGLLVGIMEWRATLIAGGAIAASYWKWWPWRK
jgi:hypothetical protein